MHASGGTLGTTTLLTGSSLTLCDMSGGSTTADASSIASSLPGAMPGLSVPGEAESGFDVPLAFSGEPFRPWFLFLTFDLAWYRPQTPLVEMTGLGGVLAAGHLVGQGVTDAFGQDARSIPYPLDPAFHGLVTTLQYLAYDPLAGTYRFSEAARTLLLP
ncbi:MAG: hypothetical protein R3F20_09880 [Planctomycetota bacterium]